MKKRVEIDLTGDHAVVSEYPLAEEDGPINFDDGSADVLVRKRQKQQRAVEVVSQYEFMEPDDEDEVVVQIEVENDDDRRFVVPDLPANRRQNQTALKELRALTGIGEEDEKLLEAFQLLGLRSDNWKAFLELPIIKRKFKVVETVLESFGWGAKTGAVKNLYRLHWADDLRIQSTGRCFKGRCVACDDARQLLYRFQQISKPSVDLGVMGTDCYSIRFSKVLHLIDTCKVMARWAYVDPTKFTDVVREPFQKALDGVCGANASMKRAYEER